MKMVWNMVITDVEEKFLTVGGKRSADGKAELFTESAGWYIRIGAISLFVGQERPAFNKGDAVRLVLEQENDDASQEAQG